MLTKVIDTLLNRKCELYILLLIMLSSCVIYLIPQEDNSTISGLILSISLIGIGLRRYCCICIREKCATCLFGITGAFAYYYTPNPMVCSIISLVCLSELLIYMNTKLRGLALGGWHLTRGQ